ncbi:MAG: polysaccharide deacetylase family protein [Candidatus Eremiobacteraeota bacterium]|nr:polysaccharide deacetylase family protein [Candidatus Eremiobacteraeota bacterium]MBC5801691.1 polysaccharide deacetylase family protein [Candidatus Eremiobacteraeota bacterium]MBC5820444.1 polysaccharide deacetylase family protein [Candidatus Eremiobacteraeota bacterium]
MRALRCLIACVAALCSSVTGLRATPSGLPQIAPHARTPYIAVLVWHDVLPSKEVWFDTTAALFAHELDQIATGGFHVLKLATLRDHLVRGTDVPPKSLVLTFDDNGSGIYRYAYPLLRAHRFPATLFVHTNYVGKTTSKHHNTWSQLHEMIASGRIDVQSLTANHPPDLTKLSDADVVHELRLSKFSLERRLGKPVYALVYPYDAYDDRVARLAADSGYTLGFTEDWGAAGDSSSLLEIHRYSVLTRFDQALSDVAAHR